MLNLRNRAVQALRKVKGDFPPFPHEVLEMAQCRCAWVKVADLPKDLQTFATQNTRGMLEGYEAIRGEGTKENPRKSHPFFLIQVPMQAFLQPPTDLDLEAAIKEGLYWLTKILERLRQDEPVLFLQSTTPKVTAGRDSGQPGFHLWMWVDVAPRGLKSPQTFDVK